MPPLSLDPFEEAVFGSLAAAVRRSAVASLPGRDSKPADAPEAQRADFDALLHQSMLNFTALLHADQSTRIHALDRGYRVELGSMRLAFDASSLRSLMAADNPGVDLAFDDEMVNFEPEADLVKKSKVPLWVLRPVGAKTILIQRIW